MSGTSTYLIIFRDANQKILNSNSNFYWNWLLCVHEIEAGTV